MTETDRNPDTRDETQYTLFGDIEDGKSGQDTGQKTEVLSELSDTEIRDSSQKTQHQEAEEEEGTNAKKNTHAASSAPQVHPPPKKEYGYRWNWSPEAKDYTQVIDGKTVYYREYQRTGGSTSSRSETLPPAPAGAAAAHPAQVKLSPDSQTEPDSSVEKDVKEEEYVKVPHNPEAEKSVPSSRQGSISQPVPLPGPLKEYEEPLDQIFTTVEKPKRFFQVGRIFATVWFEPGGEKPHGRNPDLEWTNDCPKYHDEKPIAKFRWFVVARKRLHHSLCFNITAIGPKGARWKADRGRGQDFVVLHNSNVEPSKPFETEGITKDPIAVIIEAAGEFISPWARLDCGRIYTVEDHLRVMKIGRVHTASLQLLDKYFRESVE